MERICMSEVMTTDEVAEFLRLDRSSVYRLKVPYMVIPNSRLRRYKRSDVLAWLEGASRLREALPSEHYHGVIKGVDTPGRLTHNRRYMLGK